MTFGIVFLMEFLDTDVTIHVVIKSFESFLNKILSELIHFSNDDSKEFIEVNGSRVI